MGGSDQNWLNSACHMSENAERPIKRLLFDPDAPTHPLFCFIVLLPAYGTVVPALHNTPILYYLLIRWGMYTHVCWVDNYPGGSLSRHGEIALWEDHVQYCQCARRPSGLPL